MSIQARILSAVAIILVAAAAQGVVSAMQIDLLVARVNVAAEKPLIAVDASRSAWQRFRDAADELSDIIEGIHIRPSNTTLPELQGKLAAVEAELGRLAGTASDDQSRRHLKELGVLVADWSAKALILAGQKPATAIPAPHVMTALERGISSRLNALVRLAVDDAGQMREEIATEGRRITWIVWTLLFVGLAIGGPLAVFAGVSITRPLRRIERTMGEMATGDLTVAVSDTTRRDEIGRMARALDVFKRALIENRKLEVEAQERAEADRRSKEELREREAAGRVVQAERRRKEAEAAEAARLEAAQSAVAAERQLVLRSLGKGLERLAAKDLKFRLSGELPEAYRRLEKDYNTAIVQLEVALEDVRSRANVIGTGTSEIARASADLSQRTERQAASIAEAATFLNEITSTVSSTAEGAKEAEAVVATTLKDAEMCSGVVRQTVDAMGNIQHSSQQITQIISVIDEISFQTNLLALNAGVEAARAGEAGRGFAVVASEVRALAQRSASSARQITALIGKSMGDVNIGAKLVADTGVSLTKMVAKINEINALVTGITFSTHEQAARMREVNGAVSEMDRVTQQNAAMAEETNAATGSLADESKQLGKLVGEFEIGGNDTDWLRTELKKTVPHAFAAPRVVQQSPHRSQPPVKHTAGIAARRSTAATGTDDGWSEF